MYCQILHNNATAFIGPSQKIQLVAQIEHILFDIKAEPNSGFKCIGENILSLGKCTENGPIYPALECCLDPHLCYSGFYSEWYQFFEYDY